MTDRKPCIRCGRAIDAGARLCVFCNHDQTVPVRASLRPKPAEAAAAAAPAPAPVPVRGSEVRNNIGRGLIITAIILGLVALFAVGTLVRSLGDRGDEKAATTTSTSTVTQQASAPRSDDVGDFTLVPVNDAGDPIARPATTTPASEQNVQVPDEFQREDATALSAEQYAKVLAEAPPAVKPQPRTVDPRSVVYQPPAPPPPERRQEPERNDTLDRAATEGRRTNPVPTSQPLPSFPKLRRDVTLRYDLLVGADGRVKEVGIIETVAELTPQMVSAIQRWKFKPGTLNGEPVEAHFIVDLSFNAQ